MAKASPIAETSISSKIPMAAVFSELRLGRRARSGATPGAVFVRHKLAMIGTVLLIFFILAALVGPIVYTAIPAKLNFKITMEAHRSSTRSAPTTWGAICWPARCTAAGSRSRSAWSRWRF